MYINAKYTYYLEALYACTVLYRNTVGGGARESRKLWWSLQRSQKGKIKLIRDRLVPKK
jgi:hypothetical protein